MANTKTTALVELASGGVDNADMLPLVDVSDTTQALSGSLKRYAWSSIKATLKAYFDTLYQTPLATTDALAEGATNLYFGAARVRGTVLAGVSTAAATPVDATHTILQAVGFLQKQASDLATATTDNATATALKVSPAGADTLTNKRINPRVGAAVSSATPAVNTDAYDIYKLTAQAADITSFSTGLTGAPVDGQCLVVEITGTAARAIAWGTSFEASTVALPTTTVTTAMLAVGFIYNAVTAKWRCVGAV